MRVRTATSNRGLLRSRAQSELSIGLGLNPQSDDGPLINIINYQLGTKKDLNLNFHPTKTKGLIYQPHGASATSLLNQDLFLPGDQHAIDGPTFALQRPHTQ